MRWVPFSTRRRDKGAADERENLLPRMWIKPRFLNDRMTRMRSRAPIAALQHRRDNASNRYTIISMHDRRGGGCCWLQEILLFDERGNMH